MNWSEFFAMGGYAFYVWGSYGVTALFIIIEIIVLRHRHTSIRRRLARIARMNREQTS